MQSRILVASYFAAVILTCRFVDEAVAGPVYLNLVLDPATTANNGIPAVNGMTVTSTQSGSNRWHLYALDDNEGSLGIAYYNISIDNATTVLHRSPVTTIQDPDTEATFSAGFSVFRNQAAGPAGFIQASQSVPDPTNPYASIGGFGTTIGNFVTKVAAVNPSHVVIGPTTSGQWGNYATDTSTGPTGANWLLLAEGQYAAGLPPTIGTT
jgi:hypothetical protein